MATGRGYDSGGSGGSWVSGQRTGDAGSRKSESGGSGGNGASGRRAGDTSHESEQKSSGLRVSGKSKPKFKYSGESGKASKKLTAEQKQRLEELMQRDGGEFVGQAIRENSEWYKLSKEKNVCRNCAGRRHIARNCPLESKTGKGSADLNAILTGLARIEKAVSIVNSTDFPYLCSLAEKTPLAMFPCSIDGSSFGITLLDDGATCNYVSLSYAKWA